MTDLRTVVRDHWVALDKVPRKGTWLTSALPVSSTAGAVMCANGPDGHRHLLVPLDGRTHPRPDTRSAAVHLVPLILDDGGRAVTYADLVLLRPDLEEIFTALCADVIGSLALDPPDSLVAVSQVLEGWRELLRGGTQLSTEQMAGIFGELTVLNVLLDRDPSHLDSWRGPLRTPQDFIAGNQAIEVKTTTSAEGRIVRIHGIDQLTAPTGGLLLWWMRFSTSNADGASLPELVDSSIRRVPRPRELWQLLRRAGYLASDADRYSGIRFSLVEEAKYRVDAAFPRIVPASFPAGLVPGVAHLRYSVDLDLAPAPMEQNEVSDFLSSMAVR